MSILTTQEKHDNYAIAVWLIACCAVIFGMIILGGVTRLTGSGLSMVDWAPIMGVLPPLNHVEWQEVFLRYQQFPEYQLKNYGMSLNEFKSIFWFEYGHRLLGRFIGVIFLLPFLYFLFRGKIEKSLTPKLIFMFILGGLQGLMGWYMVKSGLVNDPYVSQYRLTAHLGLAVLIYSYMLWVALSLLFPKEREKYISGRSTLAWMSLMVTGLIIITILSGGLVAGTRAGHAFNTFPLMNGQLIPSGLFDVTPIWRNFFENIITVQFDHRVLALLLFLLISILWYKSGKIKMHTLAVTGRHLLLAALVLQITLGISTLLLVVPVALAASHQAGAIILLTASIFYSHQLNRKI